MVERRGVADQDVEFAVDEGQRIRDEFFAGLDFADVAFERQRLRAKRLDFGFDLLGFVLRMSASTILLAPSSANFRAVARPNPLPPPVITAVRPLNRGPAISSSSSRAVRSPPAQSNPNRRR